LLFLACVFICQRSRFLQEHESNNILHTWRWPYRPKHVVKTVTTKCKTVKHLQ
jgi:hypothetical protein